MILCDAMLFRDWWRIETPYGYVELELDEAGGAPIDERERDDAENVLQVLTYGIENRDRKITRAIVEVFAQAHPEQFPPGLALSSLAVRDIDPLRPAMIRYLEQQVAVGKIRLFEDDVVLAKIDVLEPLKYVPQPVVPEKTTFIGVKLVDHKGKPIKKARLRFYLPDGDVKEKTVDSEGEVYIDGIAVDGMARVVLIEFAEAQQPVPPTKFELRVRLPINPDDARTFDDRFTLIGGENVRAPQYSQTKSVRDDLIPGDSFTDLLFTNLAPDIPYSLEIDDGKEGTKHFAFEGLPWGDIETIAKC